MPNKFTSLHLYLGAKVQTPEGVGVLRMWDFETECGKVTFGAMGPDYEIWFPFNKIQLILRPLTDATEKEQKI